VVLCNITVTVGTLDFHNLMDRLRNALGIAKPPAEVPNLVPVIEDDPLNANDFSSDLSRGRPSIGRKFWVSPTEGRDNVLDGRHAANNAVEDLTICHLAIKAS
jgi:hypothetical protein